MTVQRRKIILAGAAGAVSLAAPAAWSASAMQTPQTQFNLMQGSRVLKLYRPATRETLHLEYLRDGKWASDAYSRLCWILRDARASQSMAMDLRLIAILDWTQTYLRQFGYQDPVHLLSGYRSPATNEATENAAKNSQHLYGRAMDLRIPGLSAAYLGKLFGWLSSGGVGIYADSNFVHVDTGRVRKWAG